MSEMITVNKDVLITMQHQTLLYITLVANLATIQSLQPTIDTITKMFVTQTSKEEAEKILDLILKEQEGYVNDWNNSIEELKKQYIEETQIGNSETHEEASPVITE